MAIIKRGTRFPSDNIRKRYYSDFFVTILNTGNPTTLNQIYLSPIFIKKRVINPVFGIEQRSTSLSTTIDVGIYEGKNVFSNPRLLWRNTITTGITVGLIKTNSSVILEMGWYILASVRTGANNPNFISQQIHPVRSAMGGLPTETSFVIGLFGTYTSSIVSPATTLPDPLGTVQSASGATIPAIFLEY